MEPVQLENQDDLRLEMRQKSLDSLFFLCKAVLGYKDLVPHLHLPLCQFLESDSHALNESGKPAKWDKMVELPRGHLKSSICTIGYPIWRVLHDPNLRVLISNATATNASHFLRTISGHFEENAIFRWLFPEIIPEKGKTKWTTTELEVVRSKVWPESTFECIGVGGTAVSRHYDLQIEDDLVAAEHLESPEQMIKIIEWHQYAISLSVSPASLQKVVVGTRWAFSDLISFILEREPQYRTFRQQATHDGQLNSDSKPIWPERFTLQTLKEIQNTQGKKIFATQYMNNPTFDDVNAFDISIIRKFDALPEGAWTYFTAIDPALGEGLKADYSAIVTVGRNHLNDIFCVDVQRGHWSVDMLIENIFAVHRAWKPQRMGLESVLFQKVLMYPIREAMRREDYYLSIEELKPGNKKKIGLARIFSLKEYFAKGALWIRSNQDVVFKELEEFPYGAHDDVIDALAYAVQLTRLQSAPTQPRDNNPLLVENILKSLQPETSDDWTWHNRVGV